jgi:hypothetical protein
MTKDTVSNRRAFLKGGALVVAPLAAAAAPAVAAPKSAWDDQDARLGRLQDEAAIRDLHQAWLRRVNAGDPAGPAWREEAVRSLAADHAGEPDLVELAADGRSAAARYSLLVERQTAIPKDSTLGQMAHLQGGGHVRRTERQVLIARYVKDAGGWAIAGLRLESATA